MSQIHEDAKRDFKDIFNIIVIIFIIYLVVRYIKVNNNDFIEKNAHILEYKNIPIQSKYEYDGKKYIEVTNRGIGYKLEVDNKLYNSNSSRINMKGKLVPKLFGKVFTPETITESN